jgi:hypothetical protein
MNLPITIRRLVDAQNTDNPEKYIDQFSNDAIVHDAGMIYTGKEEIRRWNEIRSNRYRPKLKVIDLIQGGEHRILITEVSGVFKGSPMLMNYHISLTEDKISMLRISSTAKMRHAVVDHRPRDLRSASVGVNKAVSG